MFQNQFNKKNDNLEEEVFRIIPQINKAYETAICTRKTGIHPNDRYYTTNPVVYVGITIKNFSYNHRDASYGYVLFSKNGIEEKVEYTYEGTTCFREVPIKPCEIPSLFFLSHEVVKKHYDMNELKEKFSLSIN
jgi:hypothetical protein